MPWLGALRKLDFDHLHHVLPGFFREQGFVKPAVRFTTAEITGAYLPDQVAAMFQVIGLMPPSPVLWAKPRVLAPLFSAIMALRLRAPKLMAEIFRGEAS